MTRTRPGSFVLVGALALLTVTLATGAPVRPATDVCGAIDSDTRWTPSGSPYVTTCEVVVGAAATLTIDPGVVVRLGSAHRLVINGALQAIGTAEQPILFEAAQAESAWASIYLAPDSGPSELAHLEVTGGGAGRHEMLGIETDQATIRDTLFGANSGVAVEIRSGASPTIERCRFIEATHESANPPSALRIHGPSDAVVTDCVFQSNVYAVSWDADANPRFERNRFAFNGHDGVLVTGHVTREVTLHSLGPRNWSYLVLSPGLVVDEGGRLQIEAGTTMWMSQGTGIRIAGTLAIRGQAANEVLLTAATLHPQPGQWNDLEFGPTSIDYVPEAEEGCIVDHAILEYGGGRQTGFINVRGSSPRISNSVLRHSGRRGITVTGLEARPEIIGNIIDANTDSVDGIGVYVTGEAVPVLSFNIFRNNSIGVRASLGARPRIEPHNWFDRNLLYGAYNEDREVCVEATQDDWGAPTGPNDASDLADDACGMHTNASDDGDLVSNHVRYLPYEGQVPRPVLTAPRCGTTSQSKPAIEGLAVAGSQVHIYDNQELIGTTTADAGPDQMTSFRFVPSELAAGSHVLVAQSELGTESSGLSEPLDVLVDPDLAIDPERLTVSYYLDEEHFVQPYRSASGCVSLGSGDWRVRVHPVGSITLTAAIACPGGDTPQAQVVYRDQDYTMTDRGDGVYAVSMPMADGGALGLGVTCGETTRQYELGTVERELNGFVYDEAKGPTYGRILGATVTLYQWDAGIADWRLWPASDYYGQVNPLRTGVGGWLIYYPPAGLYYAHAEAQGFEPGDSAQVTIDTEPFVANIVMQKHAGGAYLPMLARNATR